VGSLLTLIGVVVVVLSRGGFDRPEWKDNTMSKLFNESLARIGSREKQDDQRRLDIEVAQRERQTRIDEFVGALKKIESSPTKQALLNLGAILVKYDWSMWVAFGEKCACRAAFVYKLGASESLQSNSIDVFTCGMKIIEAARSKESNLLANMIREAKKQQVLSPAMVAGCNFLDHIIEHDELPSTPFMTTGELGEVAHDELKGVETIDKMSGSTIGRMVKKAKERDGGRLIQYANVGNYYCWQFADKSEHNLLCRRIVGLLPDPN